MKKIIILVLIISLLIGTYGKSKQKDEVAVTFYREVQPTVRQAKRIGRDKPQSNEPYRAITLPSQKAVAEKIRAVFKEEPEKAIAVFRAESGLRANAQGWNCSYGVCEKSDRESALSTDCGIAQINFPGSVCPAESFDPDWNIQKAYEWKYKPNGWRPWVAEQLGRHLVFLAKTK